MVIIKLINNRYKLEELVYSNLYCSTYIAYDLSQNNKKIIVNILNNDNIEKEFVDYMISDYIKLTTVEHINIQKCLRFDIIDTVDTKHITNKQYYFSTEFIDLDETIDLRDLSYDDRIFIFKEICYALQYLHFRGHTYGNLSFDKVFTYYNKDKVNISLENVVSAKLYRNIIEYNNQFLAPEVISGESVDYSADIYSLGVILYYLITGKNYCSINFKTEIGKENGEVFRVIDKMTRFEAEERYQSVQEVMDELCEVLSTTYPFKDKRYYEVLHFNLSLVSRSKEMNDIYNTVLELDKKSSSPTLLLLYGEAGVGKSRLLRETEFMLRINKKKVMYAGSLNQSDDDFILFKKIIAYTLRNFTPEIDLINRYGSELVKVVPEIAKTYNISPSDPLNIEKENYRLINRIANYLVDFSKRHDLIITIDNISKLNFFDKKIMEILITNTKPGSIIFMATESINDEEQGVFDDLVMYPNAYRKFHITKMNIDEMTLFVKDILGVDYYPINFTTKLMEVANGTPKYIEEVIKCLFVNQKIYIGSSRKWKITIDNIYDLELPGSISDAMKNTVNSLGVIDNEILSLLSIFKSSVPLNILTSIIGGNELIVRDRLGKLMKLNIVSEKLGDWGYNYGFYDDRLKKYYYRVMVKEKKKSHEKAAIFLEEVTGEDRDYTTELIYHYTNSDNYEKAINYCIKAGEKMESLYINKQAIAFYEEALKLLNIHEDRELQCNILLKVAALYLKNGETEKAQRKYSLTKKIAKDEELNKQYITSLNKLAHIEMFIGDQQGAMNNIHEAYKLAIKTNYIEGELEAALQQCYLLPLINEEINLNKFIGKYIKISLENEMYFYTAAFYNVLGLRHMKKRKIKESMEFFLESIRYFDMSDIVIDKVRPINNIGVVYVEYYKDIEKGREYFNKSLELYENFNHSIGKPLVLANLGELASMEDDYATSLKYFLDALQLALDIGDVQQQYLCFISLSTVYTKMYKYDKAGYYLKKADEFKKHIIDDGHYFEYCYAHILYYIQLHRLDEAEEWLDKLKSKGDLSEPETIQAAIVELRINIYKGREIDSKELLAFLEKIRHSSCVKGTREYIKHLIKYFIMVDDRSTVNNLVDIDNKLESKFDTPVMELKKAFVLGKLYDNKISYYQEIITNIHNDYLDEYRWRAHKFLADEYYEMKDYYNALSNYITALDILKSVTVKIDEKHRYDYITKYKNHYEIKDIIIEIKDQILGTETPKKGYTDIDEFFDISDFDVLFNNKEFMQSGQSDRSDSIYRFNTIHDLISNLNEDPIVSIKQVLTYCADLCLAERGFVVLNTRDERKVVSLNSKDMDSDIEGIITSTNHDGKAKFKSNRRSSDLDSYLASDIKSYICIPINRSGNESHDVGWVKDLNDRRKSNNFFSELIGYLYLDTYKVFNNFTEDTNRECNELKKILSLIINNYNLKVSSSIDKLTGVYLRKYIEEVFSKQLNFALDNKVDLSIVMCDIDKFKSINDTYGHTKGDDVLRELSSILLKNIRKTDYVGRYGGEEFILILPNTDSTGAYILCEKLRKLIEKADFLNDGKKVTMSFGISTSPRHGNHEEMLIERADKALYHSKDTGRNKTSIWSSELDHYTEGFDNLNGFGAVSIGNDYRKSDIMLNIMKLVSRCEDKQTRMYDVMGYLLELSEAKECILIEFDEDNTIKSTRSRKAGYAEWFDAYETSKSIIDSNINKKSGDFFIDWNNMLEEYIGGLPNWRSYIVSPLYMHGKKKGIIILSVPINEKEFDFKTYNLVNSLNGIIASML